MPAWGVIGHEPAVRLLAREARQAAPAHAHLLLGPAHVGRGTLARAFAAALVCDAVAGERPCGACRHCRRVLEGDTPQHPDVHLLSLEGPCADDARHGGWHAGDQRWIGVCQVRYWTAHLDRTPFEARRRVLLVDPADRLTPDAQNAFLKTVEEPPAGVVIVLVAQSEGALLPTLRSRCRALQLGRVRERLIAAWLEGRGVEPDLARQAAALADGRPGAALALAGSPARLDEWERAREDALQRAFEPLDRALAWSAETAELWARERERAEERLDAQVQAWRVALRAAADGGATAPAGMPAGLGPVGAAAAVRAWLQVRKDLDHNTNARLTLDVAVLRARRAVERGYT